jgi:lipoate-protein ligase A
MTPALRILHTGLNSARWNVGMTAALVDLHRTGRAPDTLRFYRTPPSVLLGRHQHLRSAVNSSRCLGHGVDIARRITGGTAVVLSPGVLGVDLIVERKDFGPSLSNSIAWICTGLAAGIARVGLPARFQPSGSIVIDGRVVGCLTGTSDGLTLIFQGFIHLDNEAHKLAERLAAPAKRAANLADAGQTWTSLAAFLGRTPPAEEIVDILVAALANELRRPAQKGEASAVETELAGRFAAEPVDLEPVPDGRTPARETRIGRKRSAGGSVEVRVTPDEGGQISEIQITGDFSIAPMRAVDDLETALRGVQAEAAADHAREILEQSDVTMSGVAPVDIAAAIAAAVKSKSPRRPRSP